MQRLRVLEMPQHVHLPFDVAFDGGEAGAQRRLQRRPIGFGQQSARIEQFIEQDRVLGNVLRHPWAGAHQVGDAIQCMRIFMQQREISLAAADTFKQRQ